MSLEAARKKLAAAYAAGEISNTDFTEGLAVLRGTDSDSDSTAQVKEAQTAANSPERRATVAVETSDNPKYGDVVIRKLVKGGKARRSLYLWQEDVEEVANALLEVL